MTDDGSTKKGISLGNADGKDYAKFFYSQSTAAWGKLFDITRANFLLAAAMATISSTSIVLQTLEKTAAFLLGSVVICSSVAAIALCYFYMHYSYQMHGYAREFEKAWLRDKNGRDIEDDLEAVRKSSHAAKAYDIEYNWKGISDLFKNIYGAINCIPLAGAIVCMVIAALRR